MKFTVSILSAFVVAACASSDPSRTEPSVTVEDRLTPAHAQLEGTAPSHLVDNGKYSDVRFCDMMAPHHQHANEMAELLLAHGQDTELRDMARMMIQKQTAEIEELASIKQELAGSSTLPMMMSQHEMENSGVPMPEELTRGTSVDLAFLDGMLPHHSGAIRMASVALRYSQNPRVVGLARRIIDDQSREVGELISIRHERFEGVNHGFPHAVEGRAQVPMQ